MSGDAEIYGNTSANNVGVGGVYLYEYTTFTMNDNAKIKSNNGNLVGGVYIYPFSIFIMNGGRIFNNTATHAEAQVSGNTTAGGVIVGGNFIVVNEQVKSSIYNNTAASGLQVNISLGGGPFTVGGEPADSF